jgi:hypothetical protein
MVFHGFTSKLQKYFPSKHTLNFLLLTLIYIYNYLYLYYIIKIVVDVTSVCIINFRSF